MCRVYLKNTLIIEEITTLFMNCCQDFAGYRQKICSGNSACKMFTSSLKCRIFAHCDDGMDQSCQIMQIFANFLISKPVC